MVLSLHYMWLAIRCAIALVFMSGAASLAQERQLRSNYDAYIRRCEQYIVPACNNISISRINGAAHVYPYAGEVLTDAEIARFNRARDGMVKFVNHLMDCQAAKPGACAAALAMPDINADDRRRLAEFTAANLAVSNSPPTAPVAILPASGRRIALLIGNQRYSDRVGPLKNPYSDVALVEVALKKVGFAVTTARDTDYRSMDLAIKRYIARVRDAG